MKKFYDDGVSEIKLQNDEIVNLGNNPSGIFVYNESGEIVGTNGTILKSIKTSQQISIWHSPAGWYARTLAGSPLYNGVPVNAGMQIKLNDGDILTVEKDQVRVEIV